MRVFQYNNLPKLIGSTDTLQDFETILGKKPYLAKEVVKSTTNKNLSLLRIAEDFGGNIYKNAGTIGIDSMIYDWMVETGTRLQKVYIAEDGDAAAAGTGVAEFAIILDRLFYTKGCIFELENEQQVMVTRLPEKLADQRYRYFVKLVTGSRTASIPAIYLTKGKATRYISKASIVSELHDFGGSYGDDFNIEKQRQYISRFRMGRSTSGDAKLFLPNLIEEAGIYYKQANVETKMMEDLLDSVNTAGLFAQGNIDENFNCLITEEDGRPVPIGEGILPQMKRYGNFMPYSGTTGVTIQKMKDIINEVVARKEKKTGNEIMVMCNYKLFQDIQSTLDTLANSRLTTNDYFFNQAMKDRWVIGADYAGYKFAGNKILFMEETAFSNRYPDKGFGIVFNLYAETSKGQIPNVQQIGIKGMDLVKNYIEGVGGKDGKTSGTVSSRIHASEVTMFKYSSFVVNDPYGTMFIQETSY